MPCHPTWPPRICKAKGLILSLLFCIQREELVVLEFVEFSPSAKTLPGVTDMRRNELKNVLVSGSVTALEYWTIGGPWTASKRCGLAFVI